MSVKKEIAKGKKSAQEVGAKVAEAAVPLLVEWAKKLGEDALGKAQEEGTTEEQKHCRVCGVRISKDKKYVLGSRFRCVKCNHRTHKHCAESVSGKTCKKCGAK
jgi:hypothetical protein